MAVMVANEQDRRVSGRKESPMRSRDDIHPVSGVGSNMAVIGHPIHPMLVPYPLAFLTTTIVTDLAYRRTRDPFWAHASRWLLRAGLASGAAAGAVGAVDYLTIERAHSHSTGHIHAAGNALALTLACANLMLRREDPERGAAKGGAILSAATAALLAVTGWAGGELSYRHGIGVVGHDRKHGRASSKAGRRR